MGVKKDDSGRRSVQAEVEVPGTPEEVWEAIATGPGVSSWFVPVEMREDGTVVTSFGPGMESTAKVTSWDPPHRFSAESADLGPVSPSLATEWIVEARQGGKCVVRVVHSLFADTDDWDNHLEGIEAGWPGWFEILRLYLTHFRGQPSASFRAMSMTPEPVDLVWKTLLDALALTNVAQGQTWRAPAGPPPISGRVERSGNEGELHGQMKTLLLDTPAPGVAFLAAHSMGPTAIAILSLYLYGDSAAKTIAENEPAWQGWLASLFKPADGTGTAC